MGKHLSEFKRPRKNDFSLPEVFLMIYDYFDSNPLRVKVEGLFKKKAEKYEVEKIENNFSLGNYQYLKINDNPLAVSNYLKCLLKYTAEPLCTFALYEDFRTVIKNSYMKQIERLETLKLIFEKMDETEPVFRCVWKFLLHFFAVIARQSDNNKCSIKTICVIFSPILFKPEECKSEDLVLGSKFTKLLKLLITEQDFILSE